MVTDDGADAGHRTGKLIGSSKFRKKLEEKKT